MTKANQVAKAIRSIEESRQSHVDWIEYLDRYPKRERTQGKLAGDRRHHRLWVRRYNQVLRVLKGAQP